jgi:hypothetical protein
LVVGAPFGIEMPQALRAAWAFGSFSWPPIPFGIPLGIPVAIPLGRPLGRPDGIEIPAAERHFWIAVMSTPPGPWPGAPAVLVAAGVLVVDDPEEDEPQAARPTVASATAARPTAGRRI